MTRGTKLFSRNTDDGERGQEVKFLLGMGWPQKGQRGKKMGEMGWDASPVHVSPLKSREERSQGAYMAL